jgi:hypothetical protein
MLEGKCNRRLDHLVYVLVHQVIPYFVAKHCRQHFGFKGPDLELQHRQDIEACAKSVLPDTIEEVIEGATYLVRFQSNPAHKYTVNIDAYTCECTDFVRVSF